MKTLARLFVAFAFLASCQSAPAPETKENLLDLVENQKLERIREIFGLNQDVNSVNADGQTALHIASAKDLADIAAVLLARGAFVDAPDKNGKTPLHLAIEANSLRVLPLLIASKADYFRPDRQGKTPLQTAVEFNPDVLTSIVKASNVSSTDAKGNTVVHWAASLGLKGLIDYALTLPVDVTVKNKDGLTSLDLALQFPKSASHARIAWNLVRQGAIKPVQPALDYFWQAGAARNAQISFELGNTALHYAASRGHVGLAQVLVEEGASIEARDIPGNTPFHRSIESSNLDVAEYLLQKGALVNAQDFNNNSSLHLALTSKNPDETLRFLLKNSANPNLKNNFGNTALHLVVSLNLPSSLARVLIDKGADVNARNKLGNSSLLEAVREKKKDLVEVLMAAGANPFASNHQDESAVSQALRQGPEAVGWILHRGNSSMRDDSGNTALHVAVQISAAPATIALLLSLGVNPNERNKLGLSALHLAVARRDANLCRTLVTAGSDLYLSSNNGKTPLDSIFSAPPEFQSRFFDATMIEKADSSMNTPLFHTVFQNDEAVARLLIQKGASLTAQNLSGSTVLHEAVRSGNVKLAEIFLKAGASVTVQDLGGNTALHNVVYWDSVEMAGLLLAARSPLEVKNKEGRTVLQESVRRGEFKLTEYLLSQKADVNSRDRLGRTPLFDSIQLASVEMIQLLLRNGASANVRDSSGSTVMHQVAVSSSAPIVELLLSQGADLFAENAFGTTPAVLALRGSPETWKSFFSPRNVNFQNNQGLTALHFAVVAGAPVEAIKFLVQLGANLEIRNKDGKTAFDLAKALKRSDLEAILALPQ